MGKAKANEIAVAENQDGLDWENGAEGEVAEPSDTAEADNGAAAVIEGEVQTTFVSRPHMEATCLAFTKVYGKDGSDWSLTLREGVTSAELDHLFLAMEYTEKIGQKHGFSMAVRQTAEARPTKKNEEPDEPLQKPNQQKAAPSSSKNYGDYEEINRLVILPVSGAPNKARVELWGNPKLKYPITSTPPNILADKLSRRYNLEEDDLSYLFEIGKQWQVNWKLKLVDSDKLNRNGKPYKNIAEVVDLDQEQ